MCGRFLLTTPASGVADLFGLDEVPALSPRYNIAPGQPIAVVRIAEGGGRRECMSLRWGLVPSWAADPGAAGQLINARAETVAQKPSFRTPFRRRRCLVPADGFYEWKSAGRRKQPFAIRLRGGGPFAFAGLWDRWLAPGGAVLESAAVLTTEANDLVRPVHDRMPVILCPEDHAAWLNPGRQHADELRPLLAPFPAELMTAFPVGAWVSDARHEGPRCLEPGDGAEPNLF
jgi:putative SOS response-associated peptidase YedK